MSWASRLHNISYSVRLSTGKVLHSRKPLSETTLILTVSSLVKLYPQGQMIKHLESMQIGDMVVIRGRINAIQYSTYYTKHIGMIASGTGITFIC